jgi:hypothetical protein
MPAAAQTQASLASPEVALGRPASLTIRRLVPEVQMVVTAEDGHGRPVRELRAEQIKILDNGVAAPLTSFEAAADLPLRAAVVVDGSASMSRGYAAERQAALALVSDMRARGEQVFTISFAAQQEAVGAESVAGREPGGQTALYDALISAAGLLRSKAPARRVLLLMSDGEDNYSRATLVEAIAALQQAEIAVYSVSVHSARLEYPGDRVLRNIATATGGRAYFLSSYRRVGEIFAAVEGELRAQYVVGFRPTGALAETEFHAVKILPVRRGVRLRSRAGYYVRTAD